MMKFSFTDIRLSIIFIFALNSLSAQSLSLQLDQILDSRFASTEPGATVLIAKKGEIIYQKSNGLANLELGIPMKEGQVFRIASITKTVYCNGYSSTCSRRATHPSGRYQTLYQ